MASRSRLRLGFNARLLSSPALRGWNRYAINLLAAFAELGVDLFLYSSAPLHGAHSRNLPPDGYQLRIAPPMRLLMWQEYWLPRQCAADSLDVFHTPYHFGLPPRSPFARVMTLHDAIGAPGPLRLLRLPRAWAYEAMARRRADHFITVSDYSRADLSRAFHISPDDITVTYGAAAAMFHGPAVENVAAVRRKYRLTEPYVLYYGGWESRKNIPFLVRAFASAGLQNVTLLLAGGDSVQQTAVQEVVRGAGVEQQVRLLGAVDDVDLPAICAGALCFVYPSSREGFGLQICEALAVGCPTLAARATSLPEVLGEGGVTFSLDDTGELTGLLRRVARDPVWRSELVEKARLRSRVFSWRLTAEKTMETAYARAIQAHRG